jgi:hypothetical protein
MFETAKAIPGRNDVSARTFTKIGDKILVCSDKNKSEFERVTKKRISISQTSVEKTRLAADFPGKIAEFNEKGSFLNG